MARAVKSRIARGRGGRDTESELKRRDTQAGRRRWWRHAMLALGCAAAMIIAHAGAAVAQDRSDSPRPSALGAATIVGPSPRLEVPSVIIGAPASETGLGIALGRDGALPANTYIRIRGISPAMSLTNGHVIAPGAWAVPIAALPDLRVVIPANAAGKTDIHVALVAIDGGVIAEAQTTLVIAAAALGTSVPPPSQPAPSPPAPAQPPAQSDSAGTAPPLSAADRERAEGFLARGRKLLASGNIASARLFFRRAADAGLEDGALAMGDTFDPVELNRLNAVGIHPDAEEARRWYERARELGAGSAADRRLDRLGTR